MLAKILRVIIVVLERWLEKIEDNKTYSSIEQRVENTDKQLKEISEDVFEEFNSLSVQCIELENEIKKKELFISAWEGKAMEYITQIEKVSKDSTKKQLKDMANLF